MRIHLFLLLWTAALGYCEPELYWALANNDALQVWNLTGDQDPNLRPADTRLANGELPAAWAIARGSRDALEVLAARGADLSLRDSRGRPLVFVAAEAGRLDLVDYLIRRGAVLDAEDDRGGSFALAAAGAPHEKILLLALKRGLDALRADALGKTPLMAACTSGVLASVKLLLAEGADPRQSDYLGRTAADYARLYGRTEVADYLEALEKTGGTDPALQNG